MTSSRPPVRTDHTFVPSHHLRGFTEPATFQDLVGERLRQSPWLLLSAALHGVLALLIWVLVPPDEPKAPTVMVTLEQPEERPIEQPKPEPPPETETEPVEDEVVVVEPTTPSETDSPDDSTPSEDSSVQSAFEFDQWNTATGLGGGAAGPYVGRGTGGNGGKGGRQPVPQVMLGLEWLAAHQDEDGRWDADGFMKHDDPAYKTCDGPGASVHDIGVTGLALLAFLGENSTLRSGQYRDNVRRGVLWLKGQQQENGMFGTRTSHDYIYDHAIAAYAMCEAYGLSDYKTLRAPAQRAIEYLEAHRNPYSVWRYQPQDQDNDISVTGWAVMAYESGKFFGLQVNEGALKLAATFLDEVSDATGLHGYRKSGERSSRKRGAHEVEFPADKTHALTAVGLFCRYFLGQDPKEQPVMEAAAKLINTIPPKWDEKDGSIDHYYWYYATYALFQMGGQPWRTWKKALERAVVPNQHADKAQPNLRGSWDPVGAWGDDGGRVYSTAILTLTMQANYRYTRLIR